MFARWLPAVIVASLSLVFASSASADRLPLPGPCDYSEIGATCEEDGAKGTCVKHTCSRMSYAGGERKSVDYDCMRCETSAPAAVTAEVTAPEPNQANQAADPASQPSQANHAADPASQPSQSDQAADPADVATADAVKATASDPAKAQDAVADGGKGGLCNVDPSPPSASLLLLGLLLVHRRRPRRSSGTAPSTAA